jgi:phosphoribosylformylglycinamidine cyclo-ligase
VSQIYLQRGVSAKKEDVHQAIQNISKGLYDQMFCKVFPDFLSKNNDYVNLMSSDGSGTKSIIAYMYWKETGDSSVFEGIGQDALVMNLDDMYCVGASGSFLYSSIINRNKHRIDGEIIKSIIEGTQRYIDMLNDHGVEIIYTGGETADVGDVVRTISVDGSMISRMPTSDLIYTNHIHPGQIIVGLASYGHSIFDKKYNSGIGSNGLTSARHDLLSSHYKIQYPESIESLADESVQYIGQNLLTDPFMENISVGEALLSPTRSFAPVLNQIFRNGRQHIDSIVHCTGGGATKVLHFANNVKIIKDNMLPIPPLFEKIQRESQTPWKEMFQVFNMGTRMELYLKEETFAKEIIELSKSMGIDAQIIGRVEEAEKASVEVFHQNISYNYTL